MIDILLDYMKKMIIYIFPHSLLGKVTYIYCGEGSTLYLIVTKLHIPH